MKGSEFKMTFTKWLYYYKNFNSKTHYNRYIKSLNLSIKEQNEILKYYKAEYHKYIAETCDNEKSI